VREELAEVTMRAWAPLSCPQSQVLCRALNAPCGEKRGAREVSVGEDKPDFPPSLDECDYLQPRSVWASSTRKNPATRDMIPDQLPNRNLYPSN
jgi:hypothetical protein